MSSGQFIQKELSAISFQNREWGDRNGKEVSYYWKLEVMKRKHQDNPLQINQKEEEAPTSPTLPQ